MFVSHFTQMQYQDVHVVVGSASVGWVCVVLKTPEQNLWMQCRKYCDEQTIL